MKSLFKNIIVRIMTFEAKAALRRHNPKIVAVTGSVGKTSTKDAIFAVVSKSIDTRKSNKSFNSELGLPLAILGLDNAWSSPKAWLSNIIAGAKTAFLSDVFPECLILEVGADHPGDIEKVTSWLHPDITVLTRMSPVPVHIEYFKDAEEVLREKMFLAKAIKAGGTVVANADDPLFMAEVAKLDCAKVFYGKDASATARILSTDVLYDISLFALPRGQKVVLNVSGSEKNIELQGVLGEHLAYPIAAACAVGEVLGLKSDIVRVFNEFESPRGRMRVLRGVSSSAIIDDTYNSSPIATAEALKTLSGLVTKGRKIAVLGDMKELGENSDKAHRDTGALAATIVHTLVVVGPSAKLIAEGALSAGFFKERIMSFDDSFAACKVLPDFVRAGDILLVKGSQSMRMERISEALLEDKSKAVVLLARQEREWKER